MHIFETQKGWGFKAIKAFLPIALLLFAVILFYWAVDNTSTQALDSQKTSLERALSRGAIRTYALTGAYPESLEEILEEYHITYNPSRFIVEYSPNGSNLFPSIYVIPLKKEG